jgi:hypothetical protein
MEKVDDLLSASVFLSSFSFEDADFSDASELFQLAVLFF